MTVATPDEVFDWQAPQPSAAISSHQQPSAAVSSHQQPSDAISSYQQPSVAISSHQQPSNAIECHQLPSEGIRRHQIIIVAQLRPVLTAPSPLAQAANEPPVPVLCLTSAEDTVIPEAGVRAFADVLREARAPATRSVRVETLQGAHAKLHATQPSDFLRRVESLALEAGCH